MEQSGGLLPAGSLTEPNIKAAAWLCIGIN